MSTNDNFSQAVKDLLSASENKATPVQITAPMPAYNTAKAAAPVIATILRPEVQTSVYKKPAAQELAVGVSTIADGTVVRGEVHAKGDLNIFGEVQGNVETASTVTVGGKVTGDITGRDINFNNSIVKGNLISAGNIQLDTKTTVIGNVTAKSISCNGHIKGDLTIEGKAHFLRETILLGNVCAGSLVIEEGARINGDVSTASQKDIDIEDPFQ